MTDETTPIPPEEFKKVVSGLMDEIDSVIAGKPMQVIMPTLAYVAALRIALVTGGKPEGAQAGAELFHKQMLTSLEGFCKIVREDTTSTH